MKTMCKTIRNILTHAMTMDVGDMIQLKETNRTTMTTTTRTRGWLRCQQSQINEHGSGRYTVYKYYILFFFPFLFYFCSSFPLLLPFSYLGVCLYCVFEKHLYARVRLLTTRFMHAISTGLWNALHPIPQPSLAIAVGSRSIHLHFIRCRYVLRSTTCWNVCILPTVFYWIDGTCRSFGWWVRARIAHTHHLFIHSFIYCALLT